MKIDTSHSKKVKQMDGAREYGLTALVVEERIQAGDIFLFKVTCPFCKVELLWSLPSPEAPCCKRVIFQDLLEIKRTRFLSGTKRKKIISKRIVREIYQYQAGLCAYCSLSLVGVRYEVEHITPLAVGGSNNRENLCLSCPDCNHIAGALYFIDFNRKRDYILNRRKQKGNYIYT